MELQDLLVSYKPGLWDNKVLPDKWIKWYDLLLSICKYKIKFTANNINEFTDNLQKYLPYLDTNDLRQLYQDVNANNEYYTEDELREL